MIGCIIAAVCHCIIGTIWYNQNAPTGQLWMRRNFPGKKAPEVYEGAQSAMGLSIVVSATMSLLLQFILIDFFHTTSIIEAVKFGIGLSCLTTLLEIPHVLFSRRYIDVFFIDQLYNWTVVAVGSVCIVFFG